VRAVRGLGDDALEAVAQDDAAAAALPVAVGAALVVVARVAAAGPAVEAVVLALGDDEGRVALEPLADLGLDAPSFALCGSVTRVGVFFCV
jgi:hypothetical protein